MIAGIVLGSAYCFTISALRGPFDGVVTINCVLGQPRSCLDQSFDTEGSPSELPRKNGEVTVCRECIRKCRALGNTEHSAQGGEARLCKYIPASSLPAH